MANLAFIFLETYDFYGFTIFTILNSCLKKTRDQVLISGSTDSFILLLKTWKCQTTHNVLLISGKRCPAKQWAPINHSPGKKNCAAVKIRSLYWQNRSFNSIRGLHAPLQGTGRSDPLQIRIPTSYFLKCTILYCS